MQQYEQAEQSVQGVPIAQNNEDGTPIPVTIPIRLAPGVRVIFTTRLGGVSAGACASLNLGGHAQDDPQSVHRNRQAVAHTIQADLSLVRQVHGNTVFDADTISDFNTTYGFDASGFHAETISKPKSYDAGAQVTSRSALALGVFAADCLPVLFADPIAGIVAVAHCGRKGLMQGVIDTTIAAMEAKGAQRNRIHAVLGPCICGDCYEVGESIANDFERRYPQTRTRTRSGGVGIDIAQAAQIDLALAGIGAIVDARPRIQAATQYLRQDEELTQICSTDDEGSNLQERFEQLQNSMCTLENPLWFSHRRAQLAGKSHEGRFLAFIVRDAIGK